MAGLGQGQVSCQLDSITETRYALHLLRTSPRARWYVIREHDNYGEFPNIFMKCFVSSNGCQIEHIFLSDTGTGLHTNTPTSSSTNTSTRHSNIASFLARTINPSHTIPYTILTTHCHYDHILGIQAFQTAGANIRILSSSNDISYLTPYSSLQQHSLCASLKLQAPHYDATFIDDFQEIRLRGTKDILLNTSAASSIIALHTPGHTPDSLSWYDREFNVLCVGDTFYERESDITRSGSGGAWAREKPASVEFVEDSNVVQWGASMHRLLDFVRHENRRLELAGPQCEDDGDGWEVVGDNGMPWRQTRRVALCASHVTIGSDAETALVEMLDLMLRIQHGDVPRKAVNGRPGHEWFMWYDGWDKDRVGKSCRFSVVAPLDVIRPAT